MKELSKYTQKCKHIYISVTLFSWHDEDLQKRSINVNTLKLVKSMAKFQLGLKSFKILL